MLLFPKQEPIKIFTCDTCKSIGFIGLSKCGKCHGMSSGHFIRGHWLFWSYPLTRYHLNLAKGRRVFNKVRFFTSLILWLNAWGWSAYILARDKSFLANLFNLNFWISFFSNLKGIVGFLVYLGALILLYLWYRVIVERIKKDQVEHFHYNQQDSAAEEKMEISDWAQVKKIKSKKRLNIADTFTDEALAVLGEAYLVADRSGKGAVTAEHLFYALLSSNRISNVFVRLGMSSGSLQKTLENVLGAVPLQNTKVDSLTMPLISGEFQQALFLAYEEAYEAHQEYVSVTELLLSAIKQSEKIQDILFDLSVDKAKLTNVVEWARIRERLYRQYMKFRVSASHRSTKGMDKAMTAVQTPFLNGFSDDLTISAQFGNLDTCVAREKE
ncbi:MAG: hypothetical protein NT034_03085, partial [Candidatus Magasanikbacteria bacterium]|nr:hypothetical protein [Candidatus Magasanikbacteria bacterium]